MINIDRIKEIVIGIIIGFIALFFILVLAAAAGIAILWFMADILLALLVAMELARSNKCS